MLATWPPLRWPRIPGVMPSPIFFVLSLSALVATMAAVGLFLFVDAYTTALQKGYAQGRLDGASAVCEDLLAQSQWAVNTENGLVASGHHNAVTGDAVKADSAAAVHYTCTRTVKGAANIYDPSAQSGSVPLNANPTVPLAPSRKPLRKI